MAGVFEGCVAEGTVTDLVVRHPVVRPCCLLQSRCEEGVSGLNN